MLDLEQLDQTAVRPHASLPQWLVLPRLKALPLPICNGGRSSAFGTGGASVPGREKPVETPRGREPI